MGPALSGLRPTGLSYGIYYIDFIGYMILIRATRDHKQDQDISRKDAQRLVWAYYLESCAGNTALLSIQMFVFLGLTISS